MHSKKPAQWRAVPVFKALAFPHSTIFTLRQPKVALSDDAVLRRRVGDSRIPQGGQAAPESNVSGFSASVRGRRIGPFTRDWSSVELPAPHRWPPDNALMARRPNNAHLIGGGVCGRHDVPAVTAVSLTHWLGAFTVAWKENRQRVGSAMLKW